MVLQSQQFINNLTVNNSDLLLIATKKTEVFQNEQNEHEFEIKLTNPDKISGPRNPLIRLNRNPAPHSQTGISNSK